MPSLCIEAYTQKTAKEALHWLQTQKGDWAKEIKTIDVAVQLYLNSKENQKPLSSPFTKEIKKLCDSSEELSEAATSHTEKQALPPSPESSSKKSSPPANSFFSFTLDEKSLDVLKKVSARLNITEKEEVLKMLIQMGFYSLKETLKDI